MPWVQLPQVWAALLDSLRPHAVHERLLVWLEESPCPHALQASHVWAAELERPQVVHVRVWLVPSPWVHAPQVWAAVPVSTRPQPAVVQVRVRVWLVALPWPHALHAPQVCVASRLHVGHLWYVAFLLDHV